jgi:hypothetical protein
LGWGTRELKKKTKKNKCVTLMNEKERGYPINILKKKD